MQKRYVSREGKIKYLNIIQKKFMLQGFNNCEQTEQAGIEVRL
jgi:hypothetical protein